MLLAKLVSFLRTESKVLSTVHGILHDRPLPALQPHLWTHHPCPLPSWPHISFLPTLSPLYTVPSARNLSSPPLHSLFRLIPQLPALTVHLPQSVSQPPPPPQVWLRGTCSAHPRSPVHLCHCASSIPSSTSQVSTGQCSGHMHVLTTIDLSDKVSSQHRADAC